MSVYKYVNFVLLVMYEKVDYAFTLGLCIVNVH